MAAKALAYFQHPRGGRHSLPLRDGEANLTPREWEVLGMIAAGARDREIAATLQVAETTVKTHVQSILRKLQARNRVEAAARFRSGTRGN